MTLLFFLNDDGSWYDDIAGLMFFSCFLYILSSTGDSAGIGIEANRDRIHDSTRGKDTATDAHDDIRPSRNGGMDLDHILVWQQTRGQRLYPICFEALLRRIPNGFFYGRGRKDGLASRQWVRQSRF